MVYKSVRGLSYRLSIKNSLENPPCSCLLNLPFFGLSVQIHFVSMNTNYSTLKEALAPADGLAVLGVFMEVTFHFKCFFRQDEGSSRLYKFNSKHFFLRWVHSGFSYWESTAAILSICIQNFFVY